MSPEQTLNSTDIDKQSDIYSLGVVAFSMMTGELPFHDSSHVVLLYKIAHESVPDARVFRSDLPKGVAQALNKVLNKNPEKRHRSATAFVNDLEGGARRRPAKGASSLSAVFSRGGFSRSGISRGGNRAEKETPRQKSRGQGEPNQVSSEQAEPSPASRRAASRKAAQRTPVPNTPALQSHRRRRRRDNLLVASAGVGIVLLTGFLLFSFSSRSSQDDLTQAAVTGEEAAGLNAVQSSPSVPSENDESVSQNEVGFEEDRSDSEAAGETIDEADAESGGENDGEADSQARRAAQRNNQSGAPPIEEPPIEEPTEEAIVTATSVETSTLVPQGTAASRAATSTPFPTSTLIPTRTPQPTSTQPTSTQPSAASRSATRPSTQRAIPQRAITLLEPGNDITLRGSQTFRWSSTVTLEEGEGFELVFWQLGQDPFTEGRSPIGAGTESTVRFNVERAATTLGLRHQEIYAWGVRLVRLDPFEPLAYLGGGNRFKVDLGGNDGGGNDGRNNSERSGDTSGQSDGSGGDSDSGRGSAYPGPGD